MVADPGTVGFYCSGGFYAAGKMVERAVGKSLPEFADDVLFTRVGIKRRDWKWNFTLDRSQRNEAGRSTSSRATC
jgi:CubicO group peptidase (beta-lactamase class C family)